MKDKFEAGGHTTISASAAEAILALPRQQKRLIMLLADAVAIPLSLWVALILKFDRLDPFLERTAAYFLVALSASLVVFSMLGLYRAVIRFMGPSSMLTVVAGVTLSVAVVIVFDRLLISNSEIPLSAFGIFWCIALLYAVGSRFFVRYLFSRTLNRKSATRVAIYGAGDAGARLSSVLMGGPDFEPVAFIDDKKSMQGSSINGLTVFGSDVLPQLVREQQIDRILLAMPSASRRRRREILTALEPLGVHVQSLPYLTDLIAGKARIDEL